MYVLTLTGWALRLTTGICQLGIRNEELGVGAYGV